MATDYPPYPPLESDLRLATIDDVPRLAAVAVAGFFGESTFDAARPLHKIHAGDTIAAFRDTMHGNIRDTNSVTVVIEADADLDETKKTDATIRRRDGDYVLKEGKKIVVGFATWDFRPGSARAGQFNDESLVPDVEIDGNSGKDINHQATQEIVRICKEGT